MSEERNWLSFPFELRIKIVKGILSHSLIQYIEKSEETKRKLGEKKGGKRNEREKEILKEGLPCFPSPFVNKFEVFSSLSSLFCVNRSWYEFSQTPGFISYFSLFFFSLSFSSFFLVECIRLILRVGPFLKPAPSRHQEFIRSPFEILREEKEREWREERVEEGKENEKKEKRMKYLEIFQLSLADEMEKKRGELGDKMGEVYRDREGGKKMLSFMGDYISCSFCEDLEPFPFSFVANFGFYSHDASFYENIIGSHLVLMREKIEKTERKERVRVYGFVRMLVTGCISLEKFVFIPLSSLVKRKLKFFK